jgi:hypothetical protein
MAMNPAKSRRFAFGAMPLFSIWFCLVVWVGSWERRNQSRGESATHGFWKVWRRRVAMVL